MNELIKKFRESCDYNIVLIGFMGTGKSTISDFLKNVFAMDVVEMDQIIAQRQGMSISDIFETYGEKYYKFRQYHTKSKGAQEAHEAIRPTYISNVEAGSSSQEKKLYELIRKRTIACQMADAELERTTISVGISGQTERFVAVGEVISFEGFLQVYMESNDDDTEKEQENGLLPPVKLHETLSLKDIVATERFTQRPPRYTEASLVRRLEELGIGCLLYTSDAADD